MIRKIKHINLLSFNLAAMIFGILLISSCTEQPTFMEFRDIAEEEWNQSDTLTFELSGKELSGKKPAILVRHSGQYNFQNIWLKVAVGEKEFQRHEIMLATASGRWLGDKSGALYTLNFPLDQVKLQSDSTTITVTQNMRANPLIGVQAVGIKVE